MIVALLLLSGMVRADSIVSGALDFACNNYPSCVAPTNGTFIYDKSDKVLELAFIWDAMLFTFVGDKSTFQSLQADTLQWYAECDGQNTATYVCDDAWNSGRMCFLKSLDP